MVDLRIVVSQKDKSFQKALSPEESAKLSGKKLGAKIEGDDFGFPGYEFQITGGTDKDGFPMKADLDVEGKRRLLLTKGTGLRTKVKGFRKKKTVHSSRIRDDIAQLNLKVLKPGKDNLEKLMSKGGEAAGEEGQKG